MKNSLLKYSLILFATIPFQGGLSAQPYSIDWYTVDCGGITNVTGGSYALSGTLGQRDADRMSGGTESIDGGFWRLIALVPPRLTITHPGYNMVICCPSRSTGFNLQMSRSLNPAGWTGVTQILTDNGTTKCLTLPVGTSPTFYRLSN